MSRPATPSSDASIERAIATRFTEIADIGWFEHELPLDNAQLAEVKRALAPGPGKTILDAGCARGRFVKQLVSTGATVYGVDLTECFVRDAKQNVPRASFSLGSLSALPFASGTFDGVYCLEVLEHLPDTEAALAELTRVLKPGGTLLVIDKSLRGLFAWNGLPSFIVKPWWERTGRWMYPPDFPFRERWFWPGKLKRQMRAFCRSAHFRYLPNGRGKASKLYRLLPFLSMDIAWIGRK